MNRINIWFDERLRLYLWDDSEDHGGYDRCVPGGPHSSIDACLQEAAKCFGCSRDCLTVEEGTPAHYTDQE